MENDALISVVIPVYNVEAYLRECLDSVINQSYKNLEIILSDDGSTDSCPEICDEYVKKDSRIKVIHKKNGGLSDARNAGIEISSGEYITFIDSDDSVNSEMIMYLYRTLSENKADISFCRRLEIDENGNELPSNATFSPIAVDGNENCMEQFLKNRQIDTVAWGKLYKTVLFSDVRYPVGKYHEDVFTTYKLIAKCDRIFVGDKKYYNYRIRSSSIMQSSFSPKHLDAVAANEERASFIKENYPSLTHLGNAGIIYAANQCVLKLAKSNNHSKELEASTLKNFQKLYRRYERDFLRGPSGKAAKIFSLAAFVSLPLLFGLLKKHYAKGT